MKTFKLFMKVFSLTFVIAIIILVVGFIIAAENILVEKGNQDDLINYEDLDEEGKEIYDKQKALTEDNLTIAILGVDKSALRPDTIMVLNYNQVTDKVDVISVPRDAKIGLKEEQKVIITENVGWSPNIAKLTDLGGLMGKDNLRQGVLYELGQILEIEIDYYVTVDWDAFKLIIDELGGVEIDVPSYGSKFGLSPGVQTINGEQALDLCRERKSTSEGDYSRIKMQQEVVKACMKELKSMSASNITSLGNIAFNNVKTDISILEMPSFIPLISKIDLDEMEFHTIQGNGEKIDGTWYEVIDEESRLEIIYNVYGDYLEEEENEEDSEEDIIIDSNEEVNSTQY